MKQLIIEKAEYTNKKGLCDIKGCHNVKVSLYAVEFKKKDKSGPKYKDVLFLCKKHGKMIENRKYEEIQLMKVE